MTDTKSSTQVDQSLEGAELAPQFNEPEYQEIELKKSKFISTNYMNPAIWSQIKGMAETFIVSKATPKHIENVAQLVMVLQAGYEAGLKPIESMNSLYIVNGSINFWGKAVVRRLREHGYKIQYLEESDEHCTAKVTNDKTGEEYEETFAFADADASGWTTQPVWENGRRTDRTQLKAGWLPGQNRKLKMRYGALSSIIKSYIPEVLGSATDIAEIAQDYQVIELDEEKTTTKKVETPKSGPSSLNAFVNKKREEKTQPKAPEKDKEPKKDAKDTKKPEQKKEAPKNSKSEAPQGGDIIKKRKEYFALTREMGLEAEDAKEHIKDKFEVKHFNDVTLEQLSDYISELRKSNEK